ALTEDDIVAFLERRLLVPRVDAARLARITDDVLATVPADMAAEFRVVPVAIDGDGAVTLAMADPADLHVAEEGAFHGGRSCHRPVAPGSAIRDAIERHYGIRFRTTRAAPRRPTPAPTPTSLAPLLPGVDDFADPVLLLAPRRAPEPAAVVEA